MRCCIGPHRAHRAFPRARAARHPGASDQCAAARCGKHRNLIGVIHRTPAAIGAEKRLAGNVAHPGSERNLQRQLVFPGVEFLEVGEADDDEVVGLNIAQGKREEISTLHFDQRRATAFRSLPHRDFTGSRLFDDLSANSAVVDDHLTPINRRFRRKRKGIGHIKRLPGRLLEDLLNLNAYRSAEHLKPALNRFERKIDSCLFEPGHEAEGGGPHWLASRLLPKAASWSVTWQASTGRLLSTWNLATLRPVPLCWCRKCQPNLKPQNELSRAALVALFFLALAFMAGSAFAGTFRVTYTARGLVQRVNVQAESYAEARRTVQNMFPGCYVTGAQKVGK